MRNVLLGLVACGLLGVTACSTVPITGRNRVNLIPDTLISTHERAALRRLFKREPAIERRGEDQEHSAHWQKYFFEAVDAFMRQNGMAEEADAYGWEFNLIDDDTVNAWCMPGGKVVFYTGILPIAQNKDCIVAIMGHEVAHAFAKHGQERMTSGLVQQAGGIAVASVPPVTRSSKKRCGTPFMASAPDSVVEIQPIDFTKRKPTNWVWCL